MAELIGQRIAGYPIERLLEKGSYGETYQVTTSAAPLAAKILRADLRRDEALCQEVAAGWEETRAVTHPALVLCYAAGVDPALGAYALEELVPGKSLRQFMLQGNKIGWRDALVLSEQLFGALAALHKAGKVHGDPWPSNLLITQDQDLKLEGAGALSKTARRPADLVSGAAAGYLAPEVLDGAPLTAAADLYSAGACLYFILAGQDAFPGEDAQAVAALARTRKPVPVAALRDDLPPEAEALLARLLAKDPVQRHATAAAVLADLASLKAGQGLQPLQGGVPAGAPRPRPQPDAATPPACAIEPAAANADNRVRLAAGASGVHAIGGDSKDSGGAMKVFGHLATQVKSTIPQSDQEKLGDDFYSKGQLAHALVLWKEAYAGAPHAALKIKAQLAEVELKKETFTLAAADARQSLESGQFDAAINQAREALLAAESEQQRQEMRELAGRAIAGAQAASRRNSVRFAAAGVILVVVALALIAWVLLRSPAPDPAPQPQPAAVKTGK